MSSMLEQRLLDDQIKKAQQTAEKLKKQYFNQTPLGKSRITIKVIQFKIE